MSRVVDFSVSYPGDTNWIVPDGDRHPGQRQILCRNPDSFPACCGLCQDLRGLKGRTYKDRGRRSHRCYSALLLIATDRMYVLEMSTSDGGPIPGDGKVVRVDHRGHQTEIASGLTFPTAMTFGPDGALYVSHKGFGFPAGEGEILLITVPQH